MAESITGVTIEVALSDGSKRVAHFIHLDKVERLLAEPRPIGELLLAVAGGSVGGPPSTAPISPIQMSVQEVDGAEQLMTEFAEWLPAAMERAGLVLPEDEDERERTLVGFLTALAVQSARHLGMTMKFLHELIDVMPEGVKLKGAVDA